MLSCVIIKNFKALRQRHLDTVEKLSTARFQESVGSAKDASEEVARSSLAFKVMENIYAFARDAW